ncbi:MAG: TatD family hydrolase [Candidatus Nezhaarchaeota archaeon]|nr:TatD family hydrolase [Candidatus Nezhaarchaeota archaeon]MCX8142137.1 TatD family hydrolase [Candidatus Nezhaarchaeota archaeon]MDW8050082.1 TatD family hydrolase [Nitrososphaerota archaeon]
MYFDAHCHLHEFSEGEVKDFKDFVIVAVSDDLESSIKTIELAKRYLNVLPCVGIHPWVVGETPLSHINEVEKLISRYEVKGIGEVGLDRRFVPQTFSKQLKFFEKFVKLSVDYGLPINIHAVDAWFDVHEMLLRFDVERALLHWYTGPLNLLEELASKGYYVSINPAALFQKKHMKVAVEVSLGHVLVESDGPYEYKGLKLTPKLIPQLLEVIAKAREIRGERLESAIETNFKALFNIRFLYG